MCECGGRVEKLSSHANHIVVVVVVVEEVQ